MNFDYKIRRSLRAKRISIKVDAEKGVVLTIPLFCTKNTGIEFLEKNKDRIIKILDRQKLRKKNTPNGYDSWNKVEKQQYIEELREKAKTYLPGRLKELADKYDFEYKVVRIKCNRSNWGSCSNQKNINLNLNLMRLPKELQDYIMLHELTHLIYLDHGRGFKSHLNKLCIEELGRNKYDLEKELKNYHPIY